MFTLLTVETAPEGSKPALNGALKKFGFIPSPLSAMASSPTAVEAFHRMLALFDHSALDELEREVLVFTVARHNRCHFCVAFHSSIVARGPHAALVPALREGRALNDPRLEALRQFVLAVIAGKGEVSDGDQHAFFAHGFTHQHALDVVVGIATYTLSTFANRLTAAPLDEGLQQFAWEG